MTKHTRRAFLALIPSSALLAGCTAREESPSPSPSSTERATHTPETADPYISMVLPNPDESDDANSNYEYVTVEIPTGSEAALGDYTLSYGSSFDFELPDRLNDAAGGIAVTIYSIAEEQVAAEEDFDYTLYVGHDGPLLDDDGMTLTLRDGDDDVIHRIEYDEASPGSVWVRPE